MRRLGRNARFLAAAMFLGLLGPGWTALAYDAEECQECHGDLSIVEGGKGYLFVDPGYYGRTAHAEVGCPSCHDSVTDGHP
ncbi:MAG: hypothetical protein IH608_10095, partial [Proteobacteria bacterium]|nr:hypothetical protein [Pseudomonadota bacterium]